MAPLEGLAAGALIPYSFAVAVAWSGWAGGRGEQKSCAMQGRRRMGND